MSLLFNITKNTVVSDKVQFEVGCKPTQIISTALDGTTYIQNIGTAAVTYEGTVYVDRAGKAALDSAFAAGDLLRIDVKHGTYYGRIIGLKHSDRQVRDTFTSTVSLAKEAAV